MKEDVLEQVVEDYLQARGYFTVHNIKYRPKIGTKDYRSNKHSVPSDIDIVAYNPHKRGNTRVIVVNCKSWQKGFQSDYHFRKLETRQTKKNYFRELSVRIWRSAFKEKIKEVTGLSTFTYMIAVAKLHGDKDEETGKWDQMVRKRFRGSRMQFLQFSDIAHELLDSLTMTPSGSEVGRLLQLIKASDWQPRKTDDDVTPPRAARSLSLPAPVLRRRR